MSGKKPQPRLRKWVWRAARAAFALALLAALALAVAVHAFPYPAGELDPGRRGPLLLRDRHGTLLRSVPAPDGSPGRQAWVPLDRIAPAAVQTVLASEDSRFFQHRGVDPLGMLRALYYNAVEGRLGYGGSTLTMQLARMVHSPGLPRTARNKLREAVLALRMERAMGKRAILEQYLNRAYYGNHAVGLEAAARTYFGKPAAALSPGEATLLAVVPRGPALYDPLRHLQRTLRRRDHVLGLLVKQGLMTAAQARRAASERVGPALHRLPFAAPHFTDWVLSTLPSPVRSRGGVVHTSLSLPLQEQLQRRVAEHVGANKRLGMQQAGLVVLDTQSGQVLAMVGSTGYKGSPAGQINVVTRRRHPGSSLKPFVYALALENGDSPASIAYDIRDVDSRYRALGTTQPEHGPVRYREALAGSYNLAAVHTLEKVGVDALVSRLRLAGAATLEGDPRDYGLRLALGSAKARLLDLASAYGFLARGGRVTPATAVLGVDLSGGDPLSPEAPAQQQVFSEQVSWLVLDMLSDPEARRPMFGQELPVDLPFPVAVKTGTARGFADTVAVAVTRELTVAAWAGSVDGKPTHKLSAMRAAAPLVRAGLLAAGRGAPLTLPPRPEGIVTAEVCPLSGMGPGPHCPHRKLDHFLEGHLPRRPCTWHRREGRRVVVDYPTEIGAWARRERTRGGRHL